MRLLRNHLFFFVVGILLRRNEATISVPSSFDEFDENFMDLSIKAAQLSVDVMTNNPTVNLPGAAVFEDGNNKAMVGQFAGICFGVFPGTDINNVEDINQNLDPGLSFDTCGLDACCTSRTGYKNAFVATSYFNVFQQTLRNCASLCVDQCPIVFTGFSKGGAVAQIAAIYNKSLNPTVITFGQPITSELPCGGINSDKLYRFVNTGVFGGEMTYDGVPSFFVPGVNQGGRNFLLAPTAEGGVAYYTDNAAPIIPPADWAIFDFLEVHNENTYYQKLVRLRSLGNFPISLAGFASNTRCTLNSECTAPDFCIPEGFCATSRLPTPAPVPQSPTSAPVPTFSSPAPASSITSPPVVFNIPAPTPAPATGIVGALCSTDADCLPSNTCEGFFSARCAAKLGFGARCNENADCLSNSCRGFWIFAKCT